MNKRINPVGLKGAQVTDRMRELMNIPVPTPDTKSSVVELTKRGPDGKVYGIVRENHEYYIKYTLKEGHVTPEDFKYIGGLQNKKQEAYPNYANALRHLNLKFNSLNEAYDKTGQINVFESDNLEEVAIEEVEVVETEEMEKTANNNPWAICTSSVGRNDKEKYEKCVKDVKKEKGIDESLTESEFMGDVALDETNQAVEDMMEEKVEEKIEEAPKGRLTMERTLSMMDDVIDSIGKRKKKVYTLK